MAEHTFAQSEVARTTHGCQQLHWVNRMLAKELHLITRALSSSKLKLHTPIAQLVRCNPSATARSDSCVCATGDYSVDMGFWWYYEWPSEVRNRTLALVLVRNTKDGTLISINVLEYAALLINHAATYLSNTLHPNKEDPFPLVLLKADR